MGKKATFVNVPGGPNQPPYPVTGKSLAKVANWILKGVQQAHHGHPELFPYFRAWVNLPDRVVVPQYQENADDARSGVFKIGKEKRDVLWSLHDFVQLAMAKIHERDGAVVAECRGAPSFVVIATDNIPAAHDWVDGYEYVFRLVWMDGDDSGTVEGFKWTAGGVDHGGRNFTFYDVKPSRDGAMSWNTMSFVEDRVAAHKTNPSSFDSGSVGVRAAQSAMYESGKMARRWQGQQGQATRKGNAIKGH